MGDNAIIALVAIPIAGVVLFYAVRRGRGLKLSHGKNGVSLELKEGEARRGGSITVGKDMKIKGSTVGDIVGIKGGGAKGAHLEEAIDVASGMAIEDSKIGDVSGLKQDHERRGAKDGS